MTPPSNTAQQMETKDRTIERKTADAVLQASEDKVTVDGIEYTIGKPSVATIIMASALISELPTLPAKADGNTILLSVLENAKDARNLGRLLALLILGAKRVKQHRPWSQERPTCGEWLRHPFKTARKRRDNAMEEMEVLTDRILDSLSPTELSSHITDQLIAQDITGFFYLTTSLKNQGNVLKPTRSGVEDQTTAYGQ